MSRPAHIVCVGDVMVDILALLSGPLAVGSDTPGPITFGHGGSAANTAAWLALAGSPTSFVGKVGADAFGAAAVDALIAAGVSAMVAVDHAVPTGACIVLIGADGERTMVPSAGANDTLTPDDLPVDLLALGDHLHLSAYWLLRIGSRDAALAAIHRANEVGATVSVDVASADPLRMVGSETFLSWLPGMALLIANSDEATVLTGCAEPQAAAARLATRFAEVVVKCGRNGAVVATADRIEHVKGEPVQVLDSTGAGDAFAGGLLAGRYDGATLLEAVARGNALGAQAVTQVGARPKAR